MADTDPPKEQQEFKLLREFAHEICTPLNAMMGFSAMLKNGAMPEPPSRERVYDYADRINLSTRRLMQICERVLDEAVAGHAVVHNEPVDFNELCPEIIRTFEVDAKLKGVTLNYNIVAAFPILQTDPVILYEIMSNLISNAIKFTPKGGTVTVKGEIDHKNNGIILVVQDTGKGIPATILMNLVKGNGVTTSYAHSKRKGWGQGIQIVRDKVRLLEGNFEIANAPGGGTVVCIRMPQNE